jgi:hypothetical protein
MDEQGVMYLVADWDLLLRPVARGHRLPHPRRGTRRIAHLNISQRDSSARIAPERSPIRPGDVPDWSVAWAAVRLP